MVNSIIKTLLVAVIITCLFAGVAGAKKLDVKDEQEKNIGPGKDVKFVHTLDSDGHKDEHYRHTDENGQVDEDGGFTGDKIKENDHGRSDENHNGNYNENGDKDCHTEPPVNGIPEFPTVALPIAAVIGLVFFFQHKKKKEQ